MNSPEVGCPPACPSRSSRFCWLPRGGHSRALCWLRAALEQARASHALFFQALLALDERKCLVFQRNAKHVHFLGLREFHTFPCALLAWAAASWVSAGLRLRRNALSWLSSFSALPPLAAHFSLSAGRMRFTLWASSLFLGSRSGLAGALGSTSFLHSLQARCFLHQTSIGERTLASCVLPAGAHFWPSSCERRVSFQRQAGSTFVSFGVAFLPGHHA